MKKITFLMLHLNYGGIERQVTTLANNMVDDNDIEIISLYNIIGDSFYKLDDRIKVTYIFEYGPNIKAIKEALKHFKLVTFFEELVKAIKILYTKYFGFTKITNDLTTDVIISTRIEFARQIKRKDILTISQEHSFINTRKYASKVKSAFKNIDYLVVMTKKAQHIYEEWLQNLPETKRPKIAVIPNIISKPINISSLDNKQIISVGRLEEVKDFETLINIFSKVHKNYQDWTLKIVGEGSNRKSLEEQITALNLNGSVTLTGRLDETQIQDELCSSSIFVLTSISESFSLVLAEAMSCGLPCVSFDIDVGPREIITHDKDGFLIANRNSLNMQEKIELLIQDVEKRHELSENARENASRFYADNIIEKWNEIIK